MKHVYRQDRSVRQTIAKDAHDPTRIYLETVTNDRPGLEANQRIRSDELLKRDARNPLREGDVIAFSFSFPTVMDWKLAKERDPELFDLVQHGTDSERFRAAERLEFLYPQFVTTVRRNDSRRNGRSN